MKKKFVEIISQEEFINLISERLEFLDEEPTWRVTGITPPSKTSKSKMRKMVYKKIEEFKNEHLKFFERMPKELKEDVKCYARALKKDYRLSEIMDLWGLDEGSRGELVVLGVFFAFITLVPAGVAGLANVIMAAIPILSGVLSIVASIATVLGVMTGVCALTGFSLAALDLAKNVVVKFMQSKHTNKLKRMQKVMRDRFIEGIKANYETENKSDMFETYKFFYSNKTCKVVRINKNKSIFPRWLLPINWLNQVKYEFEY